MKSDSHFKKDTGFGMESGLRGREQKKKIEQLGGNCSSPGE